MVQTYQSPVRVYKHPFEFLMKIPILVETEITTEWFSDDKSEHVVERKCTLNIDAPYLLKKMAGIEYIYFTQKNSLNWRKRRLLIEASNVSFSARIGVIESCVYYEHPENAEWTCFEQSASLNIKSFFGFERTVENIAVKQYAINLEKGKEIMGFFIDQLHEEGITDVARVFHAVDADKIKSARKSSHDHNEGDPPSPADSAIDVARSTDGEESTVMAGSPSAVRYHYGGRKGSTVIKKQPSMMEDDADVRLSEQYIHEFLGQLTPLQESRLCELKYSLQENHRGKMPSDDHVLRYLRARDFDVSKAREMITTSLRWRKQHNVDRILQQYEMPEIVEKFVSGAWHYEDNESRPLYVIRVGLLDIKGLIRTIGVDGIQKYALHVMEDGLAKCAQATRAQHKPVSSWALLIDLDGLSMRHLWRPGVHALKELIEICEANYPETLGRMIITRAPRVFPVLWTLIAPFIDENTRNKIHIHAGERPPSLATLETYMPHEHIPQFLGGPAPCALPDGGHVPKSLYTPHTEGEHEMGLANLYKTAYAYKGLPHEVLIAVREKGAVLTWDFDIVKGRCDFLILLLKDRFLPPIDAIEHAAPTHNPTTDSVASPSAVTVISAAVSPNVTNDQHPLQFDRTLVLGKDVTMEAPTQTCSETDSMQGSHSCTKVGTYVMQWRVLEPVTSSAAANSSPLSTAPHESPQPTVHRSMAQDPTNTTFEFAPLHTHKCKFMYHHELIESHNFNCVIEELKVVQKAKNLSEVVTLKRGSVASLESCRSSFSSLSASATPTNEKKDVTKM